MTEPEITGSEASVNVSWSLGLLVKPGSVPDRRMPYSSAAASYRPRRLRLVFSTHAGHDDGLRYLALGAPLMVTGARRVTQLTGIALFGPRLKQDGQPGAHIVTEDFYGNVSNAPGWVQAIAARELAVLQGRTADQEN